MVEWFEMFCAGNFFEALCVKKTLRPEDLNKEVPFTFETEYKSSLLCYDAEYWRQPFCVDFVDPDKKKSQPPHETTTEPTDDMA